MADPVAATTTAPVIRQLDNICLFCKVEFGPELTLRTYQTRTNPCPQCERIEARRHLDQITRDLSVHDRDLVSNISYATARLLTNYEDTPILEMKVAKAVRDSVKRKLEAEVTTLREDAKRSRA